MQLFTQRCQSHVASSVQALLLVAVLSFCGCMYEPGDGPIGVSPPERQSTPGPRKAAMKRQQERSADATVRTRQPIQEARVRPPGGSNRPVARIEPRMPEVAEEELDGYPTPAAYLMFQSSAYPDALAAVSLPIGYHRDEAASYPAVIAFGGAGECSRPPRTGALAWLGFYKSGEAAQALNRGQLRKDDFRGLVTPGQLAEFNQRLQHTQYGGVILVCPYSPPLRPGERFEDPAYETFIMDELIPELKRRYRVARGGGFGVDGVSMGGSRSLYYGFKYPETFHSIGALQGAFGPYLDTYEELIRENHDILRERSIQLVTSDGDYLAPSVRKMHGLLSEYGIPHQFRVLSGPHDYIFNQGPGSLALLTFHSEAYRSRSQEHTK